SQTVYARNLNEKIKLPVLKKALKTLFGQFGEVVDVVAYKHVSARGQAFIVFKTLEEAGRALSEVQDFPLFGKPMELQYAKTKSLAAAKLDSTVEEVQEARRQKAIERKEAEAMRRRKRSRAVEEGEEEEEEEMGRERKKAQGDGDKTSQAVQDDMLPPYRILFLQRLPPDVSSTTLESLFQGFPGYREVRQVPARPDIAFVEYDEDDQAVMAKEQLNGYTLAEGHRMKVTYSRR
ncbi:RNA recognition protein, partial [Piptocephalis cylindrospora]